MTCGTTRIVLSAAAMLALSASPSAAAGGPVAFASYRAAYDLKLDGAVATPFAAVTGRLVTEFTGSRCAGYATTERFLTISEDAERGRLVTDARTITFETADGRFEFDNEVYSNQALIEQSSGTATKGAAGATVALTEPANKTVDLGADVVFPTEQLARIIEAADAGTKFVALVVYMGADTGETVYETATVIGQLSTALDDLGEGSPIGAAGFAGLRHWPVTISYFDKKPGVDSTPAYVVSLVLYENGIARNLRVDYGAYAILGNLTHLEMLPAAACP